MKLGRKTMISLIASFTTLCAAGVVLSTLSWFSNQYVIAKNPETETGYMKIKDYFDEESTDSKLVISCPEHFYNLVKLANHDNSTVRSFFYNQSKTLQFGLTSNKKFYAHNVSTNKIDTSNYTDTLDMTYYTTNKSDEMQNIGTNSTANNCFRMKIDGQGTTVTNLTIKNKTSAPYVGVFGYIDSTEFKDLTFSNLVINTAVNSPTGFIAGYATNGTISGMSNVVVDSGTINKTGGGSSQSLYTYFGQVGSQTENHTGTTSSMTLANGSLSNYDDIQNDGFIGRTVYNSTPSAGGNVSDAIAYDGSSASSITTGHSLSTTGHVAAHTYQVKYGSDKNNLYDFDDGATEIEDPSVLNSSYTGGDYYYDVDGAWKYRKVIDQLPSQTGSFNTFVIHDGAGHYLKAAGSAGSYYLDRSVSRPGIITDEYKFSFINDSNVKGISSLALASGNYKIYNPKLGVFLTHTWSSNKFTMLSDTAAHASTISDSYFTLSAGTLKTISFYPAESSYGVSIVSNNIARANSTAFTIAGSSTDVYRNSTLINKENYQKDSLVPAAVGDELGKCVGTGSGYGTRRTSTDTHSVGWVLASGQSGYLGANSATNHNKVKPTAADLPVVKAHNASATTSTTGIYFYYTSTSVTNVGSLQFSYSANSGNNSAKGYVVYSSTAASSGSATWEKIALSNASTSEQGASLGTSGTFTFTFASTQTSAKYYGFLIVTSKYKRMTSGTIKLLEGSTSVAPTGTCIKGRSTSSGSYSTITNSTLSLKEGQEYWLTGEFSNTPNPTPTYSWTKSGTNNGKISFESTNTIATKITIGSLSDVSTNGSATITFTATQNSTPYSASITITICKSPVISWVNTVVNHEVVLIHNGESSEKTKAATYSLQPNGTSIVAGAATGTLASYVTATVDSANNKVTFSTNATTKGTATIPLTLTNTGADPVVENVTITVSHYAESISITESSPQSMSPNTTLQLHTTIDANSDLNTPLTWSASGDADISVDQNGLVTVANTASASDTATITVTPPGSLTSANIVINVIAAVNPPTISFSGPYNADSYVKSKKGDQVTITATITGATSDTTWSVLVPDSDTPVSTNQSSSIIRTDSTYGSSTNTTFTFTANEEGQVRVKALVSNSAGNAYVIAKVQVIKLKSLNVTIDKTDYYTGESFASTVTSATATWTDDTTTASVTANVTRVTDTSTITGSVGSHAITYSYTYASFDTIEGTATINVSNRVITAVTINKTELTLLVGDTYDLSETSITPSNATNPTRSWSSTASGVASVQNINQANPGRVTAVSAGDATIRLTVTTPSADGTSTVSAYAECVVHVLASFAADKTTGKSDNYEGESVLSDVYKIFIYKDSDWVEMNDPEDYIDRNADEIEVKSPTFFKSVNAMSAWKVTIITFDITPASNGTWSATLDNNDNGSNDIHIKNTNNFTYKGSNSKSVTFSQTLTSSGTFDGNNTSYIKIGTYSYGTSLYRFSTTSFTEKISNVTVGASAKNSQGYKLSVTVNGTNYKISGSASTTEESLGGGATITSHSFVPTSSSLSGEIQISIFNNSDNPTGAIYINSISITYEQEPVYNISTEYLSDSIKDDDTQVINTGISHSGRYDVIGGATSSTIPGGYTGPKISSAGIQISNNKSADFGAGPSSGQFKPLINCKNSVLIYVDKASLNDYGTVTIGYTGDKPVFIKNNGTQTTITNNGNTGYSTANSIQISLTPYNYADYVYMGLNSEGLVRNLSTQMDQITKLVLRVTAEKPSTNDASVVKTTVITSINYSFTQLNNNNRMLGYSQTGIPFGVYFSGAISSCKIEYNSGTKTYTITVTGTAGAYINVFNYDPIGTTVIIKQGSEGTPHTQSGCAIHYVLT